MPDRLDKIVTRGGDKGETSLADGTRLLKHDPRIEVIGEVDELNSWIGVVITHLGDEELREVLDLVQHDLFDLGGGLCFEGAPLLSAAHVARIDNATSQFNERLAPLKDFVLPGGAPGVAWAHIARTVCRRVERRLTAFADNKDGTEFALQYINRLSDLLFVMARCEAQRLGVGETIWRKEASVKNDS